MPCSKLARAGNLIQKHKSSFHFRTLFRICVAKCASNLLENKKCLSGTCLRLKYGNLQRLGLKAQILHPPFLSKSPQCGNNMIFFKCDVFYFRSTDRIGLAASVLYCNGTFYRGYTLRQMSQCSDFFSWFSLAELYHE